VKNKLNLWRIYQQAKEYNTRPSTLLAITDPYVAYCLDEAAWQFCTTIETEMDNLKSKNERMLPAKKLNHLRERLGLPRLYRDPAGSGAVTGGDQKGRVKF
jgi:hypothetical protein